MAPQNKIVDQPQRPPELSQSDATLDVLFLSPEDERANTITHGCGFLLSLAVAVYFFSQTANQSLGLQLSCLAFSISMAIVYLFSTLSHAVHNPLRRNQLRAWDQGTIYLLIAGTYTPFIWQGSPDGYRSMILIAIWAAAAFGFYTKVGSGHRINSISTVTYVLLGWLPAIPLWPRTPMICFAWMMIGGLFYTTGIFFLKNSQRVRYSHAVWHIFVMLGSASHAFAIKQLLNHAV